MPKASRLPRTLLYKRCRITGGRASLAGLLANVLGEHTKPWKRKQTLTAAADETDSHRFINIWKAFAPDPMWFGNLFEFTRGAEPSGFQLEDEDADELPVATLQKLDEKTHLIDSALYFGVLKDHVIISPSGSLRAKELQDHLNWLLKDYSGVLTDGYVTLEDEVHPDARRAAAGVTAVKVKSPLTAGAWLASEQNPKIDSSQSLRTGVLRGVIPAMKRAVGELDAGRAESLDRIDITLEIKYRGRTDRMGTVILDHLAAALPDDEAKFYQIELRGGTRINAGELKLRKRVSLRHESGLPVLDDVREKMLRWLIELLESHRVRDF
jgi:hypothetical protein